MMKGVLYLRVSSREQEEEGYSLQAQVERGKKLMRRRRTGRQGKTQKEDDALTLREKPER